MECRRCNCLIEMGESGIQLNIVTPILVCFSCSEDWFVQFGQRLLETDIAEQRLRVVRKNLDLKSTEEEARKLADLEHKLAHDSIMWCRAGT